MSNIALCIGINNYPGTHMDLQGCVNDAADWAQALTARGFAVTTLLDAQATKAAMVAAMSRLIASGAAGDNLVITFSGHGTYQPDADDDEADGLDEALCPHDIQTRGEALVDDEIRAIFAARKPGVRMLLIADSCHSGTVNRASPAEPEADAPRPRFLPMGNWLPAVQARPAVIAPGAVSPFTGVLLKQQGDLLLAGCKEGPNNFSYDAKIAGRYNGAFTYYALKTLKTLPGAATYADWHRAISAYLPSASYPQSPRILGASAARRRPVFG